MTPPRRNDPLAQTSAQRPCRNSDDHHRVVSGDRQAGEPTAEIVRCDRERRRRSEHAHRHRPLRRRPVGSALRSDGQQLLLPDERKVWVTQVRRLTRAARGSWQPLRAPLGDIAVDAEEGPVDHAHLLPVRVAAHQFDHPASEFRVQLVNT